MRKSIVAAVSALALVVIMLVVLVAGAKTQEAAYIRDCPQITDVKVYITNVWGVPISETTKLVLTDGREVMSDLPAYVVRTTMIGTTHCITRLVPVKS